MNMRYKKFSSVILIFFFCFTIFFSFPLEKSLASTNSPYTDVNDTHWAFSDVVKMDLRGVVTGYDDGSFNPDKAVTQLEALLMAVRNMEVEDQLALIDTNKSIPFDVPEWAEENFKREILFAIDQEIIIPTENRFSSTAIATRAWMTQLMVRMIDKDDEARLLMDKTPDFSDAGAIPSWARGYINAGVEYSLISGYPDNTFKPNQLVTRAQSVALLSRSEQYLDLSNSIAEGRILSINNSRVSISADGRIHTFSIDSDPWVFDQDDKVCTIDNLRTNNTINVLTDGNTVKLIDLIDKDVSSTSVKGTVIHVIHDENVIVIKDSNEKIYTKTLDSSAVFVNQSGQQFEFSQVVPGSIVELELSSDNRVISVTVSDDNVSFSNHGVIYDIEPSQNLLILRDANNNFVTYVFSDKTEINIENVRFPSIEDLQTGDEVRVATEGTDLLEIELLKAQQEMTISGKIIVVSSENNLIVVEDNEDIHTLTVSNDVEVNIPGTSSSSLSSISVNDEVDLRIEDGNVVELNVTNRGVEENVKGSVMAIDTSNYVIVIRTEDDNTKTYEVSELAEFSIDDRTRYDLSYIERDMKVELELLDDKVIFIETRNTIEGTVASVNPDRRLISISDNGDSSTYIISRDVDVNIRDISRPRVRDIDRNDYVELRLDSDETVKEINVETELIYEVNRIYESSERLRVEDDDGNTRNFYLSDRFDVYIPGVSSPQIEDFRVEDMIRATYLGNRLTKIEVMPIVHGKVTNINSNNQTLTIRTYDGDNRTFDFSSDSKIIDGNSESDRLSYLVYGDRVKVEENIDGSQNYYIMHKHTARFETTNENNTRIFVYKDGSYSFYNLVNNCYVHSNNEIIRLRHLESNDIIDFYMFDNRVYEIEKR
ncbi:hypothetical protein SYNTR_2077 [Candidatus Syntrophocurvum alkaliphilum]|uniref:SLH domain-containing protein n=2 Tax=Candidatus Syntrophocurvum alkaliphilum TaxID=2293317 RepID=A0A6I6DNI0_9FIRM|nr:hypothetical protein SYNTR_2077 [Candidatus Syntrophocurvum alkaliphilum]